jgi:uncharacterized membrane protein YdbT with pleckstrin-like domain
VPFPARLLNPGEEIVVDVRPHWWALAVPTGAVVVVLAGGLAALAEGAPALADWALLALVVVALAWMFGRYVRWSTTNLVVTTDRLVHRRGVIAKVGREIPLDQLSDISYRQSIFDRIIGAGDLLLESAGRDSAEVFADLPDPSAIQNEIYRQIAARRYRGGARRELSLPEQLEKLDELRRRGVLTQAEFDAQKSQLLNRM